MEGTRFAQLPVETTELIISSLPDSNLLSVCQNEIFSNLCDWNFWRRRARDLFEIPNWYFDLGLSRQISGAYRYLEVKTQFKLSLEALATISPEGLISGIYEPRQMLLNAISSRDFDLIRQLYPILSKEDPGMVNQIIETFRLDFTRGMVHAHWDLIPVINLLLELSSRTDFILSPPEPINQIDQSNWPDVIQNIELIRNIPYKVRVLTYLIYTQNETAFQIVQTFVSDFDTNAPAYKLRILRLLRASAQTGNYNQFKWILNFINFDEEDIRVFNSESSVGFFYIRSAAGGLHTQDFDSADYNILYDAYIGANQDIINTFRNMGLKFSNNKPNDVDIITPGYEVILQSEFILLEQFGNPRHNEIFALEVGKNAGLSNPTSVYQVVEGIEISKKEDIVRALRLGIEVSGLLFAKYPQLIDVDLIVKYLPIGNVDFVGYVLEQISTLPEFEQAIEDRVAREVIIENSISSLIIDSYLPEI